MQPSALDYSPPRRLDLRGWLEANDILPRAAVTVWVLITVVVAIILKKYADKEGSIPRLLYTAGEHFLANVPLYQEEGTYRYSPGMAAVLSLFARMPFHVATYIGFGISVAAFFSGLLVWLRGALPTPFDRHQRAMVVLLATPLILGNFHNLQTNPICLAAMFGIVLATLRKQWLLAALCVAVAVSLKVYPLAIALVLLLLFPRRLWLAVLVGLCVAALLPFLFADPEYVVRSYREWVLGVLHDDRSGRPPETSYRDALLLWRVYIGNFNLVAYQVIQVGTALAIGVGAGVLWKSRKSDATKAHFLLSLVLCWIMLFGPSTESATYMMLGPLAAWLMVELFSAPSALWLRIVACAGYGGLLSAVAVATSPWGRTFITWGPQPAAAALLLLATIGWFYKSEAARAD